MDLHSTYGCCTATQINAFGNFLNGNTEQQLDFLRNNRELLRLCNMTDFALIWSINTQDQKNDKAFEKLGFTMAFHAPKTHDNCRHEESGDLKMWCIQPWVLDENRRNLIKEIENSFKINDEELARRRNYISFALFLVRKHETYQSIYGKEASTPRMDDLFPTALAYRSKLFGLVKDLTGGFEPNKDPVILSNLNTLTWRTVKERALLYREGKI